LDASRKTGLEIGLLEEALIDNNRNAFMRFFSCYIFVRTKLTSVLLLPYPLLLVVEIHDLIAKSKALPSALLLPLATRVIEFVPTPLSISNADQAWTITTSGNNAWPAGSSRQSADQGIERDFVL
jgi:hypothetical protein